MIFKTLFDASNLIKQKAYEEYNGCKSLNDYLRTKAGCNKVKSLCERYFRALDVNVTIEYVEYDLLAKTELTIKVTDITDDDLSKIMNGPILFY